MPQPTYEIEIRHDGLHKYQVVRGRTPYEVEQKAEKKLAEWAVMWQKRLAAEARQADKEQQAQEKEAKKALAAERTREAEQAVANIRETLIRALNSGHAIDWDALKDTRPFSRPQPIKPAKPVFWAEPKLSDARYDSEFGWLEAYVPSLRDQKSERNISDYTRDHQEWKAEKKRGKACFRAAVEVYNAEVEAWNTAKVKHLQQRQEQHASVDRQREEYISGDSSAVAFYCGMVLDASEYPDTFPKQVDIDYLPETRILIVDYSLPSIDDIPEIKQVKYIQTDDTFVEAKLTDAARNKLYDSLLYQIALRSIHELFDADTVGVLESITLNGWVNSINMATGQEVNACVLSVQATREEFRTINLAMVDPKACFRNLKGVGSSKLHGLAPIPPIMSIDREDKRFVSSYDVADELDDTYNLAAMDWEDFEHLVREVFEKEFGQHGGEVKVTQTSRDGGVDAVAFDPDPIRGGKIVIQAKRYTNVVDVAAVRDLYGTVLNEGAMKGILVTTSQYGPDAYNFAKDKPLALLDGGNLLNMLEKHGHKAKIDLMEAKKILAEKKKDK